MEDDIGLAELGVTARSAAVVEEQVLQEALDAVAEGAGKDLVQDEAHGDATDTVGAPEGPKGESSSRDHQRGRVVSQLASIQAEVAAIEAAMKVAEEQKALTQDGAADAGAAESVSPAGPARTSFQLQLAVMRDRLSELHAERGRLQARLREVAHPHVEQPAAASAPASSRPRFGARALARKGAGAVAGKAGTGEVAAARATVERSAVVADIASGADGSSGSRSAAPVRPQQPHQGDSGATASGIATGGAQLEGGQRPTKKAKVTFGATTGVVAKVSPVRTGGDDAANAEGTAAGGPGGMALAETEKDRLIRHGLLTPFDRLAGFERRLQNAPSAAPAPAAGAAGAHAGGRKGRDPSPFQAAGYGSLRHLGRSELTAEEAAAPTRSGRPAAAVVEEAGRRALEMRAARHTAQFLEPEQLPQQERDVRRVPPQFWHQAASGRGRAKTLRARSTLPRAKPASTAERQRHGAARSRQHGEDSGSANGGDGRDAPERRSERRRRSQRAHGTAGETDDDGASPSSSGGRADHDSDYSAGEEGEAGHSDSDHHGSGSDEVASGSSSGGTSASDGEDDSMYDDADEDFYQGRLERLRSNAAASTSGSGGRRHDRGRSGGPAARRRQGRRHRRSASAGAVGRGSGDTDAAEDVDGSPVYGAEPRQAEAGEDAGQEEADPAEEEDVVFEGGFRVPGRLYGRLFDYQRTAVKWLWELHTQQAGGVLGDEMGLGKTVQIIAYLAGLHHSGMYRPSLVVCPATVLRQWLRELRTWAPGLRVVLLHESGRSPPQGAPRPGRSALVDLVVSSPGGLLLTTYEQLRLQRGLLLRQRWGVAVLDEGHKIRNPDSEITLVCKQLHTVHRLIVSGSPIQNRLSELWSLFDFIFPGKLGTLPVFTAQFAVPIQVGGYANASPLQVTTAYKCAVVLRDLIGPYLLRRRKADVAAQLPAKTEQVLFCTLVPEQLELYRAYLASKEVGEILEGSRRALSGIDILRKICNHPDLLERLTAQDAEDYGNPARSGKLRVADRVLSSWHSGGHKALLFCQTQQMLDIVERLAQRRGWRYHRMDGATPVAARARLIDDFNTSPEVFLFLLTTKVGGLGVNLTGATRVMLYDPDWNPSTDIQARERAWRIGQSQPVTIYRLITAGTIEEKVYHRQIYKNFLTNKVLRDPRQKRFFTSRDIAELFTLGPEYKKGLQPAAGGDGGGGGALPGVDGSCDTETARIFGSALQMHETLRQHRRQAVPGAGTGSAGGVGRLPSTAEAAEALRRRGGRSLGDEDTEQGGGGDGAVGNLAGNDGVCRQSAVQGANGARAGRNGGPGGDGGGGGAADGSGDDGTGGGGAEGDESRVLRELFDGGAGIRGLLDHAKIEGANDPELITVHAEAARVAQRAAEALRRSRQACTTASIATPTWTGRHGHAGAPAAAGPTAPPPQRRFGAVTNARFVGSGPTVDAVGGNGSGGAGGGGVEPSADQPFSGALAGARGTGRGAAPSSAALLAQLRSRQQAVQGTAAEASRSGAAAAITSGYYSDRGRSSGAANGRNPTAETLASDVVGFLELRGGVAGTEELVHAFRTRVAADDMPLFKQVLRQVAALRRRAAGGQWVLKPEFASAGGGQGGGTSQIADGVAAATVSTANAGEGRAADVGGDGASDGAGEVCVPEGSARVEYDFIDLS